MSVAIFEMFDGMVEFFLNDVKITKIINKRLFDTIAPERILALESTQTENSPRMGTTVEWEDLAGGAAQNVDGESTYNRVTVEFRFYAQTPTAARELFTPFYEALGLDSSGKPTNRYKGTWNTKEIALASWDLETRSLVYEETARMALLSCNLVVRFASS